VYCQQSHNGATGAAGGGFSVQDDAVTNSHRLGNVVADYLLPQGYPDSVAPQYATYMGWRGVQYFFGGEDAGTETFGLQTPSRS